MEFEVPQGSALCPIHINLYKNRLEHLFHSAGFESQGYADHKNRDL